LYSLLVNMMSGLKDKLHPGPEQQSWRVTLLLGLFLLLFSLLYLLLARVAPHLDGPNRLFFLLWVLCFLGYFALCIIILMTGCPSRYWQWFQLSIIFVGAVVFRLLLLPLPLGLSRDAWRYLWDARVFMHGYSPYLYAPSDPVLASLHDTVYANTPYRQFPTKYPPGAELFYVLGYLFSPTDLVGLKGLFTLCDLLTCGALAYFLARKKLDPRRVIIYAWCPLPIVEFSIQGHVDALVIACTIMAVVCSLSSRRTARLLAGVFLGLAILTKLYPALLLLVLVRRKDWGLLAACALTMVLGYLPFLVLSHGQITAVVFSFRDQDLLHPSILQNTLLMLGHSINVAPEAMWTIGRMIEGVVGIIVVLFVQIQRLRGGMSIEGALLLLVAMVSSMYSYTFPWYMPALLPWIAALITPIQRSGKGFSIKGLTIVICWLLTAGILLVYLPDLR
jgi:hypothetical protein